ncbi:MAG: NAD(P)H nitroreductase [Sphingobacteriia bacterium]|nr:NAD(P)H nitroreductase [Sphingobacteriia bacterium]
MDFPDLIRKRFSTRKYLPNPIEPEKLSLCLEATRLAPSASNSQPWHFIVVDQPDLKEKVALQTYNRLISFNKFTHQAPVIVVFLIEKPKLITQIGGRIKKKDYPLIDLGIAAEHFCLQAAESGLGTCMLGWYNEKNIKKLLGIPKSKDIGLLITLGYPAVENVPAKKRKPLKQLVSYNRF